jgi:hypothetical protein
MSQACIVDSDRRDPRATWLLQHKQDALRRLVIATAARAGCHSTSTAPEVAWDTPAVSFTLRAIAGQPGRYEFRVKNDLPLRLSGGCITISPPDEPPQSLAEMVCSLPGYMVPAATESQVSTVNVTPGVRVRISVFVAPVGVVPNSPVFETRLISAVVTAPAL